MNKIPVIQTIKESYRFTFGGLGTVIGLIWLPIILLTVGGYFITDQYISGMSGALQSGDLAQSGPLFLRLLSFGFVKIVLQAMIAVAIVHEILKPLKRPLFLRFGLGPSEFRVVGGYFGLIALMIVFIVILVIVSMIIGFAIGAVLPAAGTAAGAVMSKPAAGIAVLAGLIGCFALIYIFARLGFLLAPAAVTEGGFGLERSWQLTQGNFWRIFAIALATLVPIAIAAILIDVAVLGPDSLNPHLDLARDQAARLRHSAEQMRLLSAHLPLLMGLQFLLAPFAYGMTFAPAAFAYRALTARQS
jgi:hypothetical protein